jgi:tyrosine-protein phosphatase YwqE
VLARLFRRKEKPARLPAPGTDIHSHLLPGIDDGVTSWEESLEILSTFQQLGYRRAITTPHIIQDSYRNSAETILPLLEELKGRMREAGLTIEVHAAAEYYLDETLLAKVVNDEPLLTFGDSYLLFETNFISEPLHLKEFLFRATINGYKPVLAHPERYSFFVDNPALLEDLHNRGVLFQINLPSIIGYYSRPSQQLAERLIDRGWVHFLGSDIHRANQLDVTAEALSSRYGQKALTLPLLNSRI